MRSGNSSTGHAPHTAPSSSRARDAKVFQIYVGTDETQGQPDRQGPTQPVRPQDQPLSRRARQVHLARARRSRQLAVVAGASAEPARSPQDLRLSRASIVTDSLCGSTPMTTLSITIPPHPGADHLAGEDGQRHFELGKPFLSYAPPRHPARTHARKEPHPSLQGGQPQERAPCRAPPPEPALTGQLWKTQIAAQRARQTPGRRFIPCRRSRSAAYGGHDSEQRECGDEDEHPGRGDGAWLAEHPC